MREISEAQILFLKRKKHERMMITFFRVLLFLLFIFLWEYASRNALIDSFIFSSPSHIFENLIFMFQEQHLSLHIGITLLETLISFFCTVFFSLLPAILLWLMPKLSMVLEPYLVILNSLPKSALAPLLIVWLGANVRTIIVSGMSVAIFGSIISLYTGFREADKETCKLISTLGGGKADMLKYVVLPSSVPLILSVMKVNIGLCLVGVIIGEFIGARKGLGYLIIYGSQTFKLTWVLMSIVLLSLIAVFLYGFLNLLEKKISRHFSE